MSITSEPTVVSADAHRALRHVGHGGRNVQWELWLIIALPLAQLIIFRYVPMYGAQIAFRDYVGARGIWGSPWVGLKHFRNFVQSYQFERLVANTLTISLYQLGLGFPIPILLALSLNQVRATRFKKMVQMMTYLPHFISTVVIVALIYQFLNPRLGFISLALSNLGFDVGNPMGNPRLFKTVYVVSGIWQHMGYQSVVYLAALSAIDPQLHEAAIVDGATRLQRIAHIDIPGILPTAAILLVLQFGQIMRVGFEKVYLMQNPAILSVSEIISTHVYKVGLLQGSFSYASAVGLLNNLVNLILLVIVNRAARKLAGSSLW